MEPRWDLIAAERLAFADLIDGLTPEQLSAPSLCAGWSVKQVAAHVTVGPEASTQEFVRAMLRARLNFDRANSLLAEDRASKPVADITAAMRSNANSHFTPPMMDWNAPLTDILIHQQDVAVPLGITRNSPVESWAYALDFLTGRKSKAFGVKQIPKVRLAASDSDWQFGEGPEVRGPSAAIALALSGRSAAIDDLEGPGLDLLSV